MPPVSEQHSKLQLYMLPDSEETEQKYPQVVQKDRQEVNMFPVAGSMPYKTEPKDSKVASNTIPRLFKTEKTSFQALFML